MFMWLKSKKGFTLVELMIVLALLGLGAASLANLFTITYKSFNKSEERYIKQEETKRVAELLQSGTNIGFAFGVEIYDDLNVIPPVGTKVKGAYYLYTDPDDGFLYVRESNSANPIQISYIPLYIYFEVVKKRELDGTIYDDTEVTVPWKNQCGLLCSINSVEENVDNYTYPLDDEDIYYSLSVSYHFPNMLERDYGRVNIATDGSVLKTLTYDQESGEPTETYAETLAVGNVIKVYSDKTLLGDSSTTEINLSKWCFIATASFGKDSPDVGVLCEFRDNILLKNAAGKWFVKKYYLYSPAIAEKIEKNETLKLLTRTALKPFVAVSYVALNPEWLILIIPIAGTTVLALLRKKQRLQN